MTESDTTELEEQPLPENASCPECGAGATHETIVKHRLSKTGYYHDDIDLECEECETEWTLGVPIGEADEFKDDLWCDSCDESYFLVHRVVPREINSSFPIPMCFHLKCPNCFNFEKIYRTTDANGDTLVGYPQITGVLNADDPLGF